MGTQGQCIDPLPDFRRQVLYVPGYDPFPPRRYRELYRAESAKQAALSGFEIAQSDGGPTGWSVTSDHDGLRTEARIDVLEWSDIVRDQMETTLAQSYARLARTAWTYLRSGALRRLAWLRRGPVIAGFYPAVMLIAQALLAGLAGALVGRAAGWALGLTGVPWLPALVGLGVAGAVFVAVLRGFKRVDHRLFAHYLMADLAFGAEADGAYPQPLDARITAFSDRIRQAMTEDWDEVLVIGHSSGAHVALSAVAEAMRGRRAPSGGPKLSILTLGQCVPMISFLPGATRLRADLHDLARRRDLFWLDISAPGDGAAFALCDPVAVSGVTPPGGGGPLVLSAAYTRTLRPETRARLRWRFHRLHFQYLCAFDALSDRLDEYDYFRVTAGPLTLVERFGARAPSPARIDVAASAHVAMAPVAA